MRKLLKTKASREKKTFFAYNLRLNLRTAQLLHKTAEYAAARIYKRVHHCMLLELRDALSIVPKPELKPRTRRR